MALTRLQTPRSARAGQRRTLDHLPGYLKDAMPFPGHFWRVSELRNIRQPKSKLYNCSRSGVSVQLAPPCGTYLHEYIDGAALAGDPKALLFQTYSRATGQLTGNPLPQANAYMMIQRRSKSGEIATKIGNHTFRATGVTAYLKNGGTLENAALMANHASTRTTQLYDRRAEEVTLDEVERILV